jgi:hypothetical protein
LRWPLATRILHGLRFHLLFGELVGRRTTTHMREAAATGGCIIFFIVMLLRLTFAALGRFALFRRLRRLRGTTVAIALSKGKQVLEHTHEPGFFLRYFDHNPLCQSLQV